MLLSAAVPITVMASGIKGVTEKTAEVPERIGPYERERISVKTGAKSWWKDQTDSFFFFFFEVSLPS